MSWMRNDLTILEYLLQTNVPVQILEKNEVSDQERTGFLNILYKMCNRQRSVPKSMRIACRESEQVEKYCGGQANVFKGENRGRPVAIKVVRISITSDLEKCLGVRPF